jgi:glycosyltransferase involved in cell wall biosynthesis
MNKVSLNFICKNESHIIDRMLQSALPIIDMIVAVDTGSDDDTIDIIQRFGKSHNIPTYVFTRPFDNFCNSRNYALMRLKEVAHTAGWDLDESWGFTVDCDEWVQFLLEFKKEDLYADFYVVRQRIGRKTFSRHGLYKLSKDLYWESPIHETIAYTDPTIIKEYELNIEIVEEPVGASWKGDLEQKFLRYATVLTAYLDAGHNNFRTVFFIGDSYNAAGGYAKNDQGAKDHYELADHYFSKALNLETSNAEVRFLLYKKIAENREALRCSWTVVEEAYLQAFMECPSKAESLAPIIEHYIDSENWEQAYYYSVFSHVHFSLLAKKDERKLYNDESLYQWRLLFCRYFTAYQSGRKKEAKRLYRHLSEIRRSNPSMIAKEDLPLVALHSPIVLRARAWRKRLFQLPLLIWVHDAKSRRNAPSNKPSREKRIHYAI